MRLIVLALVVTVAWVAVVTLRSGDWQIVAEVEKHHMPTALIRSSGWSQIDLPKVVVSASIDQEEKSVEPIATRAASTADTRDALIQAKDGSEIVHVVFSTDCSGFQDWQTEVVWNSASWVRQQGPLTRIASGCEEKDKLRLNSRYAQLYGEAFGTKYHIHYTPRFDQDTTSGKSYKFYNKPRGIEHWLDAQEDHVLDAAPIVALIDPDFVFLKPLTSTINKKYVLMDNSWKNQKIPLAVQQGTPLGQKYGLGSHWVNFDRLKICGPNSNCLNVSHRDAAKYYPVGPPYLLHYKDWKLLAPKWTEFAPRVYLQYPYLLAEMYAYCCAAAHLGLKHFTVHHMMLSNVNVIDEGWQLTDSLDISIACGSSASTSHPTAKTSSSSALWLTGYQYNHSTPPSLLSNRIMFNELAPRLPNFLHFCQNYRLGPWLFAKRRIPHDLFTTCNHPFLMPPPPDVHKFDYELQPPGNPCKQEATRKEIKSKKAAMRSALMLCLATAHVNAAAGRARAAICPDSSPQDRVSHARLFDLSMQCGSKGIKNRKSSSRRR